MALMFHIGPPSVSQTVPLQSAVFLAQSNWDDYGHKTLFHLTVFDEFGTRHDIGSVKIGFVGQPESWTVESLSTPFPSLAAGFFSVGQDADYYSNLVDNLSLECRNDLLLGLKDVAVNRGNFDAAKNEKVFRVSLLRDVSDAVISDQYARILRGERPLTKYNFRYIRQPSDDYSGYKLDFNVKPDSTPSSNVHILIGRNGVGKTTLLNGMVGAILQSKPTEEVGQFEDIGPLSQIYKTPTLAINYFSAVVSVSFSAFDPFVPPATQSDSRLGTCYYYVGLKKQPVDGVPLTNKLKTKDELQSEFCDSVAVCLSLSGKKSRWIKAIQKLESDDNFADMNLGQLVGISDNDQSENKEKLRYAANSIFHRMSSGHAVVLLSITKLVETVEEKTLVLIDEPESHLHPPLLSAFTRAVSELLMNRNGVAIIATHSPVVLQEVPKSCVSILWRSRLSGNVYRPEVETFAENVGVLTREVFGLEVQNSGFHELLEKSVSEGKTYEEIVSEYNNQLGFEGKAILRSLVHSRDAQSESVS